MNSTEDQKILDLIIDFRKLARKMSPHHEHWDDLVSEMLLYYWKHRQVFTGMTRSFLLKKCWGHARNTLHIGKSIDSKRRDGVFMVSMKDLSEKAIPIQNETTLLDQAMDQEAFIKIASLKLTPLQRKTLQLLLEGYSPSEIACSRKVARSAISKSIRVIQKRLSITKNFLIEG